MRPACGLLGGGGGKEDSGRRLELCFSTGKISQTRLGQYLWDPRLDQAGWGRVCG